MKQSHLLVCLGLLGAQNFYPVAVAEDALSSNIFLSSMLPDRGEQLSTEVLQASLGKEWSLAGFVVHGGISLIDPVGANRQAFDQEIDYTLGIAWETEAYAADIFANWLTYPGEETDESLEIASEITFSSPLSPTLLGFYDANLDDWGLEATAGPDWQTGDWTLYTIGRAGFVALRDGSATRNYAGLEAGASRALSDHVELGLYGRADWADEDSFANELRQGEVLSWTNHGAAIGMRLNTAF